jgi:hypothetical protein
MKKVLYLFFTAMSFFTAAQAQNTAIKPATLAGPTTSGSSDQPWGAHRRVTQADRDAVAMYRSGQIKPAFSTNFTDSATLHAQWLLQSDDNRDLKSCRRPQNIVATKNGLRLQTLMAPADCRAQWSTGIMWSKFRQKYGFFEARIRIADISGLNNAFWLVTDDHFEIDIAEIHYPDYAHLGLQLWRAPVPAIHGIGIGARFKDDLSQSFHDFGLLWTPSALVYEVDGEPIGAFATHDSIAGTAAISFATALADFAGKVPDNPQGHDMAVQSLRVFALQPDAAAHPLEIGIDRSKLSMQPEAVREKTLEDIHAFGATWFRDGLSSGSAQGVANFVDEVRRAKQQKLNVLVNIVQMDTDYDNPEALPNWRIGNRTGWKEKKLSQINLDKYAHRLRTLFDALKAANLTIDAVEFGNEDDTYAYDADVPNGHEATPEELKTWLRGYGQFLKVGAEILHDPHYFPQAKIITFGMAHSRNIWDNPPHHFEIPANVVAKLRDVDGYNYLDNSSYHVDGLGTHIYAARDDVSGWVKQQLQEDIKALGLNKPFWVTEWGFGSSNGFPNKKGQTLNQAIEEFLNTFNSLHQEIPMGPVLFYSYDGWLADKDGNLLPLAKVFSNYIVSLTTLR